MQRIVFIITLCLISKISAKPIVHEQVREYLVYASDLESLAAELNRASPLTKDGHTFHANTDTSIKWQFWLRPGKEGCKIERVKVLVDIRYRLPKLKKSYADSKVLTAWKKYYPALVKHEKTHAQIAITAAYEIEKALRAIPTYRDCETLSQKADIRAQKIVDQSRLMHKAFDKHTDHGKTQGAIIWGEFD